MQKLYTRRENQIREILGALENCSADSQVYYFDLLFQYYDDRSIDFIYQYYHQSQEIHSLEKLVHYLTHIERGSCFDKLYNLIVDPKIGVRKVAMKGVLQLELKNQETFFLRMLKARYEDVKLFAVQHLSQFKTQTAMTSLIHILETSEHEDVLVATILSLGKMRAEPAFRQIQKLAGSSSEKVRDAALQSLGRYTENYKRNYIERALQSESEKIREQAYYNLLKSFKIKHEKRLAKALQIEKKPQLIRKALTSIRSIQTQELFEYILNLLLHHSDIQIRLLANSIFQKIKTPQVKKGLLKYFDLASEDQKVTLIPLIVLQIRSEHEVHRFLFPFLQGNSPDKIKCEIIQSLGAIEEPFMKRMFEDEITKKSKLSKIYLQAYLNANRKLSDEEIVAFLERYTQGNDLEVQFILAYLLRFPKTYVFSREIEEQLIELTASSHDAIRYLAIRCLGRTNYQKKLNALLEIGHQNRSRMTQKAVAKTLIEVFQYKPHLFLTQIEMIIKQSSVFRLVSFVFQSIKCEGDSFDVILRVLTTMIHQRLKKQKEKYHLTRDSIKELILLKKIVKLHIYRFLEQLQYPYWTDVERWLLLKILLKTRIDQLKGIQVEFMAAQYQEASLPTKQVFLEFFMKLPNPPRAVCLVVSDSLGDPALAELYPFIYEYMFKNRKKLVG